MRHVAISSWKKSGTRHESSQAFFKILQNVKIRFILWIFQFCNKIWKWKIWLAGCSGSNCNYFSAWIGLDVLKMLNCNKMMIWGWCYGIQMNPDHLLQLMSMDVVDSAENFQISWNLSSFAQILTEFLGIPNILNLNKGFWIGMLWTRQTSNFHLKKQCSCR